MDDPRIFNKTTYPLVFDNISLVINRGAYILENLHHYCDPITNENFALTFFNKLTSTTGKGCTTLRGKIPTFVIRVLIYANMIQTRKGVSCTGSYLLKFHERKTNDSHSMMEKYIKNYVTEQWRIKTLRESFDMTDSMSISSRSNTSNISLNDIQSNDSSRFDVAEAMVEYDDTKQYYTDAIQLRKKNVLNKQKPSAL